MRTNRFYEHICLPISSDNQRSTVLGNELEGLRKTMIKLSRDNQSLDRDLNP
jgi:hypothetical protein